MRQKYSLCLLIGLFSILFYFLLDNLENVYGLSFINSKGFVPVRDSKMLDANAISTVFRNNGVFNVPLEYPKGSGQYLKLFSGLWIGARVKNDTLIALAFNSSEFGPGYTDSSGNPHGLDDTIYRIYKLTAGVNNIDRMLWPNSLLSNSDQGAPVYFDQRTQTWKPLDFAAQTMFFVYTDCYAMLHNNPAGSTGPLKADIKQVNYAFDINGPLGQMVFTQFTIINRSNNVWNNTFFSILSHDAVGDSSDDRCGCDSALWLSYSYSHIPIDPIYGSGPPAVGLLILRGAVRYTGNNNDTVFLCKAQQRTMKIGFKNLGMSVFNWFRIDTSISGVPSNYRQSYRYMSGNYKNGTPITHPNGYVTKYMFSGDPVIGTGWLDTQGVDQRLLPSTGPVDMSPGDTQVIVIGQIAAQGSNNMLSVGMLRTLAALAKVVYYYCFEGAPIGIEGLQETPYMFTLSQNYPNPFNPITKIRFSIPLLKGVRGMNVKLTIFDLLGKEVKILINQDMGPGDYEVEWNGTNFASGVYFYKFEAGDFTLTQKMVLIK